MCQDLEIENEIIPRIGSGFAGGMGNTGAVCGAVVGAVMAIGLKQGRDAPTQDMAAGLASLKVVEDFRRRFEAEMDTIICRDLTGTDLTTEEGIKQFMSSDKPMTVCLPSVGTAYRLVTDILKETS